VVAPGRSRRRHLPSYAKAGGLLVDFVASKREKSCGMSRNIRKLVATLQPAEMNRMLKSLACLAIAALAVGSSEVPAAGTPATPPAAAAAVSTDYLIGPGDKIQIYVWQNPDLSVTVPVRQDGKVSTPLVEDMQAAGKTASILARDIEKVLSEYVRSPKVNVFVLDAVSAFSQVKVTGQVKTPQALPYHDGMRVLDAVLAAGGLTDFAAGNRARVVRTVDGKQQEIKVRLNKLLDGGDMSQNIALLPGDVLLIPQSRF